MSRDVIMPALGMAQKTGLIVRWLKQAGDPVKAGDVLMEVATDKAVMEVEADADGTLTDVSAAAGEEVPVGEVIARIADGSVAAAAPAGRAASHSTGR
jgi:pyruvate/2-oxoglutarate dehydrogenase complex dihydrolipoamide acyltransferase (E2) component